ncbi:MAG: hypothetical protein AWU57_343 [Marinobacter sp. T13-3]|nr:MAG: hypothetical protein AWU57_343 [Marinobacter sp. T13-3]
MSDPTNTANAKTITALENATRQYEAEHPEMARRMIHLAIGPDDEVLSATLNPKINLDDLYAEMPEVDASEMRVSQFAGQLWKHGNLLNGNLPISLDTWRVIAPITREINQRAGIDDPGYSHPAPGATPAIVGNPTDLPVTLAFERLAALNVAPNPHHQQSLLENLDIALTKSHRQTPDEALFSDTSRNTSWAKVRDNMNPAQLMEQALKLQVKHDHPDTPDADKALVACATDQTQLMVEHRLGMHALSREDTYAWAHSILNEPERCRLTPQNTDKDTNAAEPPFNAADMERLQATLNHARTQSAQLTGQPKREEGIIDALKRQHATREVKTLSELRDRFSVPAATSNDDPAMRLAVKREQTMAAALTRMGKRLGVVRDDFDGYSTPMPTSTLTKLIDTNLGAVKDLKGQLKESQKQVSTLSESNEQLCKANDVLQEKLDHIAALAEHLENTPEGKMIAKCLAAPTDDYDLAAAMADDEDPFIGQGPQN